MNTPLAKAGTMGQAVFTHILRSFLCAFYGPEHSCRVPVTDMATELRYSLYQTEMHCKADCYELG